MLVVSLDRLLRERRLILQETIEVAGPEWSTDSGRFDRVDVRLEVHQAGADVVAMGEVEAGLQTSCRRCLADVVVPVREPLSLAFQAGIDEAEAERREVYVLPSRSRELDLTEAIREHVLLAAPRFATCDEACRGLCPHCGVNLNEATCTCGSEAVDERWGPLLRAMAGE